MESRGFFPIFTNPVTKVPRTQQLEFLLSFPCYPEREAEGIVLGSCRDFKGNFYNVWSSWCPEMKEGDVLKSLAVETHLVTPALTFKWNSMFTQ